MDTLLDDSARVSTLAQYDVLDTPDEAAFDRITRLASTILQAPIAFIAMVDHHRIWLKAGVGITRREAPREITFCSHTIQGSAAFIVPDTLADPRFAQNPFVTGDPNIRFYLGVPLRMNNGQNIGTLCTLDTMPRQPTQTQIAMLADLARIVVDEIELRQLAMTDSLTGALTRRGLENRLQTELERSHRYDRELSLLAIDLDMFKAVNDRYGHAAGDVVLHSVVEACQARLRTADVIGRVGGEEFIVLLPETSRPEALVVAERLRETIARLAIFHGPDVLAITASIGVTTLRTTDRTAAQALDRADRALYSAKAQGRNRVVEAAA